MYHVNHVNPVLPVSEKQRQGKRGKGAISGVAAGRAKASTRPAEFLLETVRRAPKGILPILLPEALENFSYAQAQVGAYTDLQTVKRGTVRDASQTDKDFRATPESPRPGPLKTS